MTEMAISLQIFTDVKKRLILPQKLTHANQFFKNPAIFNKIFVTLMSF
ncbi:hypothetical protein [Moraxella lacunata]